MDGKKTCHTKRKRPAPVLGTFTDEAHPADPLKNFEAASVSCQRAEPLIAEAVAAGLSRKALLSHIERLAMIAARQARAPDRDGDSDLRREFRSLHCSTTAREEHDVALYFPPQYRAGEGQPGEPAAVELWELRHKLWQKTGMKKARRVSWLIELVSVIYPPLFGLRANIKDLETLILNAHHNHRRSRTE